MRDNIKFKSTRLRRFTTPCILIMAAVCLQGCIFIRLLKTKNQLAEFDEFIQVTSTENGLTFTFIEPHLTHNDLNRLGIFPVEETASGNERIWKTGFVKTELNGSHRSTDDLWLYLTITDEYLTAMTIPAKYVNAFTGPVIVDVAKAFGNSKVNGFQKVISIEWSEDKAKVGFITDEVVQSILGIPHDLERSGTETVFNYSYRKPNILEDDEARKEYSVQFTFKNGELSKLKSRAIRIDFDNG